MADQAGERLALVRHAQVVRVGVGEDHAGQFPVVGLGQLLGEPRQLARTEAEIEAEPLLAVAGADHVEEQAVHARDGLGVVGLRHGGRVARARQVVPARRVAAAAGAGGDVGEQGVERRHRAVLAVVIPGDQAHRQVRVPVQGLAQDRVLLRQPVLGEVAGQIGEVEEAVPVQPRHLREDRPQVGGMGVGGPLQMEVADMREREHAVPADHGAHTPSVPDAAGRPTRNLRFPCRHRAPSGQTGPPPGRGSAAVVATRPTFRRRPSSGLGTMHAAAGPYICVITGRGAAEWPEVS